MDAARRARDMAEFDAIKARRMAEFDAMQARQMANFDEAQAEIKRIFEEKRARDRAFEDRLGGAMFVVITVSAIAFVLAPYIFG